MIESIFSELLTTNFDFRRFAAANDPLSHLFEDWLPYYRLKFGTFHDLRRAILQARWILLDGYFWTQENFVNANDFLLKYKDLIRYAVAIPGYAGELLIRTSDNYLLCLV